MSYHWPSTLSSAWGSDFTVYRETNTNQDRANMGPAVHTAKTVNTMSRFSS